MSGRRARGRLGRWLLLLLCCLPVVLGAVRIHPGLGSAWRAVAVEPAPLLVVFSASWCQPCEQLHRAIVADPGAWAPALHIVFIDIDAQPEQARRFAVHSVPTLVLIDPDRVILARAEGARPLPELAAWIAAAQDRRARGLWAGLALDTPLPSTLSDLLKESATAAPARRNAADRALVAAGAAAVPTVIAAVEAPYLGERLAADRVLRQLAPQAPLGDPWAARAQRRAARVALCDWWAAAPTLGPPVTPEDTHLAARIAAALDDIAASDAVRRTAGMTRLVACGRAALPAITAARAAAERSADASWYRVLDDLRWALLIDTTMAAEGTLRGQLARGDAAVRRAAAQRLGTCGPRALPALRALLGDPDPLMREVALHALQQIGGAEAEQAIAAMLNATDANLRMVAAVQLGKRRGSTARQALEHVLADPDETVALTAIAALVEHEDAAAATALVAACQDERWRIRAAAAAALGQGEHKDAAIQEALEHLLDDADAFVVSGALMALAEIEACPEPARLRALVQRQADLIAPVGRLIAEDGSDDLYQLAAELFSAADAAHQAQMLAAMIKRSHYIDDDEQALQPLIDAAAVVAEAAVRRVLVDLLLQHTSPHAQRHIERLLRDPDAAVRRASETLCARVLAIHAGVAGDSDDPGYGRWTQTDAAVVEELAALYARLHSLLDDSRPVPRILRFLLARRTQASPPVTAALMADLAALGAEEALGSHAPAIQRLVLHQLAWDELQPWVATCMQTPALVGLLCQRAAQQTELAQAIASEQAPALWQALMTGSASARETIIEALLEGVDQPLLLAGTDPLGVELRRQALAHPEALVRALGVFALGWSPQASIARLRAWAEDPSPGVRRQVANSVVLLADETARNACLIDLLEDADPEVVCVAVAGLLDQGACRALSLDQLWRRFRFEDLHIYLSSGKRSRHYVLQTPEIPADLRARLWARAQAEEADKDLRKAVQMLLICLGDATALSRFEPEAGKLPTDLLLRVAADPQHGARFLEAALEAIANQKREYEAERLLDGLQSDHRPPARRLRRAINRMLRILDR